MIKKSGKIINNSELYQLKDHLHKFMKYFFVNGLCMLGWLMVYILVMLEHYFLGGLLGILLLGISVVCYIGMLIQAYEITQDD